MLGAPVLMEPLPATVTLATLLRRPFWDKRASRLPCLFASLPLLALEAAQTLLAMFMDLPRDCENLEALSFQH
jgi:hypothetical protein